MLVDSNILLRTLQPHHPLYPLADDAIQRLPKEGQELHIVAQNLTRLKTLFNFLAETPAIHPVWEALVMQHRVSGKPAHDARLVAAMRVHGLTSILTFDKAGFARYLGIEVVHPADVMTRGR